MKTGAHAEQVRDEVLVIRERLKHAKGGPMHSVNCAYLPRDMDRLLMIVEAYGKIVEPALRGFAEHDHEDDFGARVHQGLTDLNEALKTFREYGVGKPRFVGPLPPSEGECARADKRHPVKLLEIAGPRAEDRLEMMDFGDEGVQVISGTGGLIIEDPKFARMVAARLDDWADRRARP